MKSAVIHSVITDLPFNQWTPHYIVKCCTKNRCNIDCYKHWT